MTMKFIMKNFHLVSKYDKYCTWDEKQNVPFQRFPLSLLNFQKEFTLKLQ